MIGEVLDGKYRVDRQLGAGGMGNVYLATHLGTTRIVAVKVIAPRWAADPRFLARFQREAQACGRLRHPNIVNVTDFGIARADARPVPYLVMEFLDGQTLSAFQEAQPRPPLPVVADLLDQVALALEEAHRHDIVHRDLKPENIWLEPTGRGSYNVKVLDFGVAKMKLAAGSLPERSAAEAAAESSLTAAECETAVMDMRPPSVRLPAAEEAETVAMAPPPREYSSGSFGSGPGPGQTMPGSVVGTPAFMSPEQALGADIDYRSDIYSMAVVAYFLVCGELPFAGRTSELIEFHRAGNPKPPASVAKAPRDVSDAVMAGLARDPAARPPSAVEFARRFHNAVDAEFFALRRSKAFLMQHLGAFTGLLACIFTVLLSAIGLLAFLGRKLPVSPMLRNSLEPLAAPFLAVFCDNLLRAGAAFIAVDEKVRVRRFVSFRVCWRLVKALPSLAVTQARSLVAFGPGWVIGDCLWPVLFVAENLRGKDAILRSRRLMAGLGSAGRALAIRHLALAAAAAGNLVAYLIFDARSGSRGMSASAAWFPVLMMFAAAPLFLYDRTAARQEGPLLQLDARPKFASRRARSRSVPSSGWRLSLSTCFTARLKRGSSVPADRIPVFSADYFRLYSLKSASTAFCIFRAASSSQFAGLFCKSACSTRALTLPR